MLREYEAADAGTIKVEFDGADQADLFNQAAEKSSPLEAMYEIGHADTADRLITNQITMALVSDALHHIYEALTCLEKRKFVVALNLLRKPFKESLVYLSWLFSDRQDFLTHFNAGNPERLTTSYLGNHRSRILHDSCQRLAKWQVFNAELLEKMIFDKTHDRGLEPMFQHAVHLVTVHNEFGRTSPQNFNWVFKNVLDDDHYEQIYVSLPYVLFYFSWIVAELFEEISPMEESGRTAFEYRTVIGYSLLSEETSERGISVVQELLQDDFQCPNCNTPLKITRYNALRITLTESFRCTRCRHIVSFPFSWMC